MYEGAHEKPAGAGPSSRNSSEGRCFVNVKSTCLLVPSVRVKTGWRQLVG